MFAFLIRGSFLLYLCQLVMCVQRFIHHHQSVFYCVRGIITISRLHIHIHMSGDAAGVQSTQDVELILRYRYHCSLHKHDEQWY